MKRIIVPAFIVGFVSATVLFNLLYLNSIKLPRQLKFAFPALLNYDSLCVVGNIYTIYGSVFEKHKVVIIDKKDGFVIYTYPEYVGDKDNFGFRPVTCRQFIMSTQPPTP